MEKQQKTNAEEVLKTLQTAHPELFRSSRPMAFTDEGNAAVVEDVIAIVCDGKRYRPRGGTEEYRIPEDISTGIASACFGVNAYDSRKSARRSCLI